MHCGFRDSALQPGSLHFHCRHYLVELMSEYILPSLSLISPPPTSPIPSLCWPLKMSHLILFPSWPAILTFLLSPSPHMIFDIQTSVRMYSIIVHFFTGHPSNGSPGCKDKRRRVWCRGEIDDKIYSQYGIVPCLPICQCCMGEFCV